MVEVDAAQIPLQGHLGWRERHRPDGVQLGWDWHQTIRRYLVAKESDLRRSKDTLVGVQGQACITKSLENSTEMRSVSGMIGTRNKDVVQIDESKTQVPKNTIH